MLDRPIAIEQFCAHRPHLGQQGKLYHVLQPIRSDDLGIVVEEHHHLALGRRHRLVVQPGVVEGPLIPQKPYRAPALQFLEKAEASLIIRAVINEDNLKGRIGGFLDNALHAGAHQCRAVPGRDEDGNQGIIARLIKKDLLHRTLIRVGLHPRRNTKPAQVFIDYSKCRYLGIRFFTDTRGSAARTDAPVVQNPGDVNDLPRLQALYRARRQIIILGPFIANMETADCIQECLAVDAQMGNQVMAPEQAGIPVTLEIGVLAQPSSIDLVFIGIENTRIGVALQGLHHPEEGIFRYLVIIIQKGDKFTLGQGQGRVGGSGDMSIFLTEHHFDAGVFPLITVQDFNNPLVC